MELDRKIKNSKQMERYNKIKNSGYCPKHPKIKVDNGQTYCSICLTNWTKLYKKYSKDWDDIIIQRGQNKCSVCGYDKCIDAIDLHHLNPEKKEYKINLLRRHKFKSEYLKELDKCIPLCANCHRELHYVPCKHKIKNEWYNILKDMNLDKCSKCNYSGYVIDLHHKNPEEKEVGIAILKRKKFKPECLKELDKCIPLCRNCHRELHCKEGMPNGKINLK